MLVTTEALYRKKVEALRASLPSLEHVLAGRRAARHRRPAGHARSRALLAAADDRVHDPADRSRRTWRCCTSPAARPDKPKGAIHVHEAVVAHHVTARFALDSPPGRLFWCTADPGWVTGTSYGIIAPLTHGVTSIVDEADFDAERWYAHPPRRTRHRLVHGADRDPHADEGRRRRRARSTTCHALRFLASVGEPLNPEAVVWGVEAFGLPFHDNWWQTETGGIMIANYAAMDIRPGSMGRPLPGIEAAIVRRDRTDASQVVDEPDIEGELALRPGWPSMFRGYLSDDERYRKCFAGGYYLTGDLARRDADGYYWFVGRADDVIKSSGHLIGPFEVESVLLEHPAVAEAGVIGKPDPVAFEIVKAFVALKPGHEPSEALRRELLGFARMRLGAAVAPKEIEFRPTHSAEPRRARSCAACSRRASWACPKATLDAGGVMTSTPSTACDLSCARCCASAASRRSAPSCTAPARSAGSSTSTSARRRSRSAPCRRSRRTTRSSPPIGSTATRWRAASRRTRSWRRCTASAKAAAAAAAARCTCSTPRTRFYGGNAIVGGGLPLAVGLALADTMQQRPRVTACFFGDGAVAEGEFHESLNLAALWKLPVLFLCENNLYAMGTRIERAQSADRSARPRPRATDAGRGGRRHGCAAVESGDAAGRRRGPAWRRAGLPRVPDLPLPRALDVRRRALSRQGRSRGVEAARSDRDVRGAARARAGALDRRGSPALDEAVVRRNRPTPSRSPRPARGSRSRI